MAYAILHGNIDNLAAWFRQDDPAVDTAPVAVTTSNWPTSEAATDAAAELGLTEDWAIIPVRDHS